MSEQTQVAAYSVRKAHPNEITYLVNMGERLHKESLFRDMDYDHDKVRRMGLTAAEGHPRMFLGVVVNNDFEVPVAVLLACIMESYFGHDSVSNDLLLMVEKQHRGKCTHELRILIDWYKTWAREAGAKRVYLGTSTGIEPVRTAMLFESCGFKQIGTLHEA